MNEVIGWTRKTEKPPGEYADGRPAGPWHAIRTTGQHRQAWCGSLLKGIGRQFTRLAEQPEGRACPTCLTAVRQGKPRSYRR